MISPKRTPLPPTPRSRAPTKRNEIAKLRKAQSEVGSWMTAVLQYRIHEKCYVAQPEAGAQHSLSKARSEYRVCRNRLGF